MDGLNWLDSFIESGGDVTASLEGYDPLKSGYPMAMVKTPKIVKESLDPVFTEEYIGKIPEFEEVSELFDKIIKQCRNNLRTMNPNKLPEHKRICEIIKEFFGLKDFLFYWVPENIGNAFTLFDSVCTHEEFRTGILKRIPGRGFYDTDHAIKFCVFVYTGCLLRAHNLTGREMTALLLHELGHNCDKLPYVHMSAFTWLLLKIYDKTPNQYNNEFKQMYYDEISRQYNKLYKDQEDRDAYDKYIRRLLEASVNRFSILMMFENVVLAIQNLQLMVVAPILQLLGTSRRKMEQFADSFPTTYGFGKDLITGLGKIGDYSAYEKGKKSWFNQFQKDLLDTQMEIYVLLTDEHGSDQSRAKDCLLKLRRDLRRGDYASPEIKEELINEIEKLELQYNKVVNCNPEKLFSFKRAVRKVINALWGGRPEMSHILPRNQM